ncbi:beta-ketoacyl-[acyl-carrier-protein] synthase family protein [Streptomyces ipomoeae]|uniref:beta-ketoacyl-[acyl-carrier-protein] synthase family protein n=1 Tax=Streptomyces ipomoeae TaxID=103232 RepID=UPI001FD08585|nr:beta-ketoacyl-[acyl-carrier-protein] synthase family protein [Streptomyces ipomoeae]MDX2937041.1 beta-ketoacyl-[acyl-carrier-protein] synthase family protein [Streptomyces ipomoeae]
MTAGADVVVTGIGLITPAGHSHEVNWDALRRGRSLAVAGPDLAGLPVDFSSRVTGFDAEAERGRARARRLDRFTQFALTAARRAVADAGLDPGSRRGERVGVVLGVGSNSLSTYVAELCHLGAERPERVSPPALPHSIANMAAGEVAIDLGACGPDFTTAGACASGATAIGAARDLLRSGACDIVPAGGSESARSRMTATCFTRMRALSRRRDRPALASRPFDRARDGFVLGEGAAVLVLERRATARQRHARMLALLSGYGAGADAHHPVAPHPGGAGAIRAVTAALDVAGCRPRDIGHINAHGTSTALNDAAEAAALTQVRGPHPGLRRAHAARHHVQGRHRARPGSRRCDPAAYTVLALRHRGVPPVADFERQDEERRLGIVAGRPRPTTGAAGVSCSFGFGGQNAVLLFTAVWDQEDVRH